MSAATNALKNIEDIYPLAPMQEGLLFHTLLYPGSGMYLMQDRYLLEGTLDHAAFRRAWQQVVDRHCVLRTSFVWENQKRPLQVVHKQVTAPVIELDWRGKNPSDQIQELNALLTQELHTGFDFTKAPLLCLRLIRLTDRTYRFVRSYHHVLMDAWCFSLFMVDFFAFYEAQVRGEQKVIPRPRPYRDYIAWLQQQDPRAAEHFWRDYLRGFTVPTPLGIEGGIQQAGKNEDAIVADQVIHLSEDITGKLSALAQQHQLTLNTFVQGAWALLLNGYSGEREVVFGVTVAGRPPELDGVESMLGLFINSLPLRVSINPGAPLLAWLKALLAQNVGMRQYEYAPLVQIQGLSEVPRGRALFDSLLVFESAPVDPTLMAQEMPFDIQEEGNRTHTNYPLTVVIVLGTELGLQLSYDRHAFESATIARMLEHFQSVLEQMATQPDCRVSDIKMLREPEQHQVIQQWNMTRAEYPAKAGMAELFAARAARTPAAVAVQCGTETLTYAELDRQATLVAAGLEAAGVGPDRVVGVLAERSPSLVALILGVFKAGAGYLPLDPQHPTARWRQILTQSGVRVLLTQTALEDQVRTAFSADNEAEPVDVYTLEALLAVEPIHAWTLPETHPDQIAYVIFTSGSTGVPKGAMVTQQGMINNVWGKGPTLRLTESDVVAQTASACFDISVWQLLSALLCGGRVEIISDEIVRDPPRLLTELARTGVTVAELVPSLLREVVAVEPAVALPRLRWLLPTGEAVTPELCRSWFSRYPTVPMLNAYGPAECADDVAYYTLQGPPSADELVVPIGRPAANLQLYILAAELTPVPVGVSGELCVGGVGVGRGYLQEPGRTAERFVPDPFSAEAGARLYRTGDIGRHRADGTIEFMGRRDHQVKVRGYRIELGEIEAALAAQPGVEDQVVVVREAQPGQPQVVGYVVGEAGRQPEQLRRALRERLPEYMVPALVMSLEALPLTPNGKVDRKALPAPDGGSEGGTYVPPQTPAEELLAGIWAEVLGRPRVGRSDNFFDLGGHSLLATQIMSRVRNIFHVALPLRTVFDCPTIVEFARAIESTRRRERDASASPLIRVERTQSPPLSFAQERLWFLDQLEPDSSAYNLSTAVRLRGALDAAGLQFSLQALVKRHEALRTSCVLENNVPVQVIAQDIPNILIETDLSGVPLESRETEVRRIVAEEEQRPFSLSTGGLLRARLLRLEEQDHVLLITMHHIVSDGWSMGIFIREMIAVYQAFVTHTPLKLPEMPIQYADFATWQRAWLSGTVLQEEVQHWKNVLAGVPSFLALPTDRIRPAVQTYRGAAHRFTLPITLSKQLVSLSRTEGVTLFMTLLAAFQILLARYSGQEDFCIGTPVANRNRLETEGLIGFFVNTLVLRSCMSSDPTCQELLKRIREMVLDAQAHQDVPFEKIVEELQPQRSLSYSPLFQTLFVLQNTGRASLEIPGLTVDSIDVEEQSAKFDVTLECIETEEGVSGSFIYCSDLFDEATIVRMTGHFQTLLEELVVRPKARVSELTLLTEAERHRLDTPLSRVTNSNTEGLCVHQLIERQAEQTPHAVAVTCGASSLTYGELNAKANQLARYLRSQGVGSDATVGVCLERSVEVMVGVLGILKAGGAYVAMDPAYPQHRRDYMLRDSRARWLVTQEAFVQDAAVEVQAVCLDRDWSEIGCLDGNNLSCVTTHDNLLYLIYTSGSTGLPKGSGVTHRGECNLLTWYVREFGMRATDRVLVMSALGFDLTQKNMFAPLLCGGQVIFPDLAGYDDQYLRETIHERAITWINCTPSAFYPLVEAKNDPHNLSSLRRVFLGGEPIDHARLAPWMASSDCEVVNMYGPTECTDIAAFYRLDSRRRPPFGSVPIGMANENILLRVLDRNKQLVPTGVPGELYIGGAGVSRGYQHQPALTAEKFVPDPLGTDPGSRLYKTGDLVRYREDGNLEFLGRLDHQVKIRGFRIELGEIEATLASQPGVREAVVVVREDHQGARRLVGYVVGHGTPESWRTSLRNSLPEYMVPTVFMALSSLPVTPNGKIDRAALPSPVESGTALPYEAPQNQTEEMLTQLWAEVLGISRVGRRDNFFELGGYSLLAVTLMNRLRVTTGSSLPLAELFRHPTPAGFAHVLYAKTPATPSRLIPFRTTGIRPPLYCFDPSGSHVSAYRPLAAALSLEQPVFGIDSNDLWNLSRDDISMTALAEDCADMLNECQAGGPYHLLGWSKGGVLALATAQALERRGRTVGFLGILDTQVQMHVEGAEQFGSLSPYLLCLPEAHQREILALDVRELQALQQELVALQKDQRLAYAVRWAADRGYVPKDLSLDVVMRGCVITRDTRAVMEAARFAPVMAPITVWWCDETLRRRGDAPIDWSAYTTGNVEIHTATSDHTHLIEDPRVHDALDRLLEELSISRSVSEYSDIVNEAH